MFNPKFYLEVSPQYKPNTIPNQYYCAEEQWDKGTEDRRRMTDKEGISNPRFHEDRYRTRNIE
jgi:hypothetical protein